VEGDGKQSPKLFTKHNKNIYRNTKVRIKCNEDLSEVISTNKGVRQGCGLSPVLFNIYINIIVQEFNATIMKGIQLNKRKYINNILYADDQILMSTSEDDLQKMVYHLNLIARKYNVIISSTKTKPMAMCGNQIQRVKIEINHRIT
jgi:hypothetical protein